MNPLTSPILDEIARAQDAGILHDLEQTIIPHCAGITDDERRELVAAVRARFATLKSTAKPAHPPRGRWTEEGLPQADCQRRSGGPDPAA